MRKPKRQEWEESTGKGASTYHSMESEEGIFDELWFSPFTRLYAVSRFDMTIDYLIY